MAKELTFDDLTFIGQEKDSGDRDVNIFITKDDDSINSFDLDRLKEIALFLAEEFPDKENSDTYLDQLLGTRLFASFASRVLEFNVIMCVRGASPMPIEFARDLEIAHD